MKTKIFLIVFIVLFVLSSALAGFLIYVLRGQYPFRESFLNDEVEKIVFQYGGLPEYEMNEETMLEAGDWSELQDLLRNLKISIPRIDNTPLFGGSLADFYIYLKNGEVHRINCYTTTGKYGFRFAYVDIDGKSYFTDYWYFMAMLEFVEPYYRYTRYGEK